MYLENSSHRPIFAIFNDFSNENYPYFCSNPLISYSFLPFFSLIDKDETSIDPLKTGNIFVARATSGRVNFDREDYRSAADDHSNRNFLLRNALARIRAVR